MELCLAQKKTHKRMPTGLPKSKNHPPYVPTGHYSPFATDSKIHHPRVVAGSSQAAQSPSSERF